MADNKVTYTVSLKDLFSDTLKKAGKGVDDFEGKVTGLQGTIKNLAMGAAAAFAGSKIFDFLSESVTMYDEAAKSSAQLSAAIKSTGGAAGLTQEALEKQAAALQKVTLFDDDVTKSAMGVLLTFTNISGEIFTNTVPAIQDLSTRMGGDLNGAALQLGKALQDPIHGYAQLRRTGVSFSDAQIKQMKNFQETNRLAEAQKIILAELNKEVGGSAEAAAKAGTGPLVILKNEFNDIREDLGRLVVDLLISLKPAIQGVVTAFRAFVDALKSAGEWLEKYGFIIKSVAAGVATFVVILYGAEIAIGVLTVAFGLLISPVVLLTSAVWALNAAFIANPIGFIVAGLVAVGSAVMWAWKKFAGFRGAIMGAWEVMKALVIFMKDTVIQVFTGLGNVIKGVFTLDSDAIDKGLTQAANAFRGLGKTAKLAFDKGWQDGLKDFDKDNPTKPAHYFNNNPQQKIKGVKDGEVVPSSAGTSKVTGQKVYTINIDIKSLVNDFKVMTTTINEAPSKIKEMITRTLIDAVNDAQIIGGQ